MATAVHLVGTGAYGGAMAACGVLSSQPCITPGGLATVTFTCGATVADGLPVEPMDFSIESQAEDGDGGAGEDTSAAGDGSSS